VGSRGFDYSVLAPRKAYRHQHDEEELQAAILLHIRHVLQCSEEDLDLDRACLPGVKMSLQGETLCSRGGLLGFVRTNSPTSARHEDGLEYIRI